MPGFARNAGSKNERMLDKVKFEWSESMQSAFEEVKRRLASAPFLAYLDYDKPFVVCPYAFSREMGALTS